MLISRQLRAVAPASSRVRFRENESSLLAIEPGAATALYDTEALHQSEPRVENGVAIVEICGPLEQYAGFLWDGYDAIQERFKAALASEAGTVLLVIDSPGGDVAGLFDAVHAMRLAAREAGKKVVAFAGEAAYSAAYAIATVASEIYLPAAGGVGSVGVIATVYDRTAMTAKEGLNVVVLTSGDEKADGHPDIPLEDPALDRMQARVDGLALQFAELVAESRGDSAEKWLKLQAGVRFGQEAVDAGLADAVIPCYQLLEKLASTKSNANVPASAKESKMDLKTLRANLEAAQRSGDQAKIKAASDALLSASDAKKADEDADEGADESADEEDEDAKSEEDSDEDAEAEAAEAEEAGDDEEPPADEDEEDEDEDAKKDGKKSSASRIARAAAQLTGKSNPDEIVGTLRGMVASARQGREAQARLEKIETRLRKADVEKLIAKGMRDRKITPASKAHFEKIGMRSPRELRAMLKAMAPVAAPRSREADQGPTNVNGYHERPSDPAAQVASNFGISLEAMAVEAAKYGTRFPRG